MANSNLDDRTKMAFESAGDTSKQYITLTTTIIALTITFGKDTINGFNEVSKLFLGITWLMFLISIGAGLLTLQSLIASLDMEDKNVRISVFDSPIPFFAGLQIILFWLGLVLTAGVFFFNLVGASSNQFSIATSTPIVSTVAPSTLNPVGLTDTPVPNAVPSGTPTIP